MKPATTTDFSFHHSESYLRQLCEHLDVALLATDTDLNVRLWNAAATRMFGAGAERMIGTSITSLVPQERRRVAERVLRRAVEAGESADFEFQYPDAKGRPRELIVTVSPILSKSGTPAGASACFRDITRRISMQNELNESRKMRALGTMAGAIAHHFNNILGGVITRVDYAIERNEPTVAARVLRQTSRALLRASRLVNGLLALSTDEQRAEDLADAWAYYRTHRDEITRQIADNEEA